MKIGNSHIAAAVVCAAMGICWQFIPAHEGDSLASYRDVGGVWTACGGVSRVPAGSTYTAAQCQAMTQSEIGKFMQQVAAIVPSDTTAEVLAADTSFAYNVGIIGFSHSTTFKLQNSGDIRGSCNAMLKWFSAGGRDCRIRANNCYGVYQRRIDERDLCMKGIH